MALFKKKLLIRFDNTAHRRPKRRYLGWNEAEKAYYIADWIGYIAEWLSKLGYHLDGKMFAVVEGGMSYYTITVDGDKVTSEEFIPDATYVDEFYACEESEDKGGGISIFTHRSIRKYIVK